MQLLKILFISLILVFFVWLIINKHSYIYIRIKNQIEEMKNKQIFIILFFLLLFSEGWIIFLRKLPFIADEVYSLSGAAFFAGYNWKSYMSLHKFYNFGYTMLLSPIFKIFSNPISIYRAMLFINIILHIFMTLLVYYIVNKKLRCSKLTSIMITLVSTCNSIVLFFRGFVYNELPLALIVWLILFLLLELIDAFKIKRILLSGVLGIVTAYAYIIHSRCVIVFVTLAILFVLYRIIYKKWIVQPIIFSAIFTICIYGEKYLNQFVRLKLYLSKPGVVLSNSVEQVVTSTSRYESLSSFSGIIKIILHTFSLSGALTIEMGGIFTLIIIAVFIYMKKNFKSYILSKVPSEIFIISTFSIISLWGMIASIALVGATNGIPRFLLYSRYFSPFIGPFIMFGLFILNSYKGLAYKSIVVYSMVFTFIVSMVYIFYDYPILNGTIIKKNASLHFFFAFRRYPNKIIFSKSVFAIALFLLLIFTVIYLILYKRKQFILICLVAMLFSIGIMWVLEEQQNIKAANRKYEATNGTYQLIENQSQIENYEIYCLGDEAFRKSMLFALYDKHIEFDKSKININNKTILFSNKLQQLERYNPDFIFQLDENEWIATWDVKLKNQLKMDYKLCD